MGAPVIQKYPLSACDFWVPGVASGAVGHSDLHYVLQCCVDRASCWLVFVFILEAWDFGGPDTTVLASLATTGMVIQWQYGDVPGIGSCGGALVWQGLGLEAACVNCSTLSWQKPCKCLFGTALLWPVC